MGVTEWYVNGSPIDTLREILKRRTQSRPGGPPHPPGPSPKALAKVVGTGGPGSSLEARNPSDLHISPLVKKLPPPPGSPLGHSPTASPPPTARKMFPGLTAASLPKKLKPEQMRVEIKREMLPGALHGEPHPSEGPWGAPREDMTPLNLCKCEPMAGQGKGMEGFLPCLPLWVSIAPRVELEGRIYVKPVYIPTVRIQATELLLDSPLFIQGR